MKSELGLSEVKLKPSDLMELGLYEEAHRAYLEGHDLSDADLSYQEFSKKFVLSPGDLEELNANPSKDVYFTFCKILGELVPAGFQDKHRYFDPNKIEPKNAEELKKQILGLLAGSVTAELRDQYRKLFSDYAFEPLFENLFRHSQKQTDTEIFSQPFDADYAKGLLEQLQNDLADIQSNPGFARNATLHQIGALLGPLVNPLLRNSEGQLDLSKIPAKSFDEFKEFLLTQVSVDGIAFNSFALDSYQKVLAKREFSPVLRFLYQPSNSSIDEALLQKFTAEIVQVSAERFVQNHLNQRDGRRMLRGILGDPSHYTKEIRSDVVKAIASVGEAQNVAGHARYHSLTNNISTWNYFNVSVTDEELDNATRIADGILDGAEYMEEKAEQAQRLQQEEPEQVWVLEEEHAGRKISAEDIQSIQKLIEEKQKKNDPRSQAQVKLAKFWLMTVDNRLWGSGGTMELGVHRGYLLIRTEVLLEQCRNMASEAEFLSLNGELQDLLHGELNSEGSPTWNWVKDKTVGHGLADVFERMPDPLKAPYEDLRQFSDEVEYAHAMGQRFRFDGIQVPTGDAQVDEAAAQFIFGLQQTQRSLWYGYKQHKLLSRSGSQIADLVNLGDVSEIREANQVIDGMIERLRRIKNKTELENEIKFLNTQLKADGILHQASVAAEMDAFEQIIGLGQTIAVIAAITFVTQGAGTEAAVAEAAEAAQAASWAARAVHGIQTGATLTLAENGISMLSGEVRQGEDTVLSLAKDSLATGVAMGVFTPFGAQVGHSLEKNILQRLFARYTQGSLTQNVLHFASDTALEFGEELFDASLRGTFDGHPEISFDQFREIGMVTMAGGGTKMGEVVSGFRHSSPASSTESNLSLDHSPANDNANPVESPSAPVVNPPGSDVLKWAAAAGIAALVTPNIAEAATEVGKTSVTNGFWPGALAAIGLGTMGILGMVRQGNESSLAVLRQLDDDLLSLQGKTPHDPAILEKWAVISDNLTEKGDPRGEWIQLELELERENLRQNAQRIKQLKAKAGKFRADFIKHIQKRYGAIAEVKFKVPTGFDLKIVKWEKNNSEKLNQILEDFFGKETPSFIRILDLSGSQIGNERIKLIAKPNILGSVLSLNLDCNMIGEAGIKTLAESQFPSHLISLQLGGNRINAAGAEAIASSQVFSHLTELNLRANKIGIRGAKAIAESKVLVGLTSLNLESTQIGNSGATILAQSESLGDLTSLNLTRNKIGVPGARAIAESKGLSSLISIDLAANPIGPLEILGIKNSSSLPRLKYYNGCEFKRAQTPASDAGQKINAYAGPALLGLDFLLHGQPTIPGVLAAGLASLASTKIAAEYYRRFSDWVRGHHSGESDSKSDETLALGFLANSEGESQSFSDGQEEEVPEFIEDLASEETESPPH